VVFIIVQSVREDTNKVSLMADDAELIKAGVQGMVEGTLSPFAKILDNLFGPASLTLGIALNERMRRFTGRSQQMLEAREKGGHETELHLTLIIPIIQHGAIEENDEVQDRWAALLANTVGGGNYLPAAPEILKQLSTIDVCFLQLCYEHALRKAEECYRNADIFHVSNVEVTDILYREWRTVIADRYGVREFAGGRRYNPPEWALTEGNCLRLGLIKERLTGRQSLDRNDVAMMLTDLGFRFIELCQIPSSSH
jgi:hypothetical protein